MTEWNAEISGAAYIIELPEDKPPEVGQVRDDLVDGITARIDRVGTGPDGEPGLVATRVTE